LSAPTPPLPSWQRLGGSTSSGLPSVPDSLALRVATSDLFASVRARSVGAGAPRTERASASGGPASGRGGGSEGSPSARSKDMWISARRNAAPGRGVGRSLRCPPSNDRDAPVATMGLKSGSTSRNEARRSERRCNSFAFALQRTEASCNW
jgi:hypothetical protein